MSAGVVVVLIGFIFRSLLMSLRSVLSLALVIGCTFGIASLVYDDGGLNWLNFYGLEPTGGITWLIPVICFSICVGLSLDYDVLLITRFFELRGEGYDAQSSVRLAQHKTGKLM